MILLAACAVQASRSCVQRATADAGCMCSGLGRTLTPLVPNTTRKFQRQADNGRCDSAPRQWGCSTRAARQQAHAGPTRQIRLSARHYAAPRPVHGRSRAPLSQAASFPMRPPPEDRQIAAGAPRPFSPQHPPHDVTQTEVGVPRGVFLFAPHLLPLDLLAVEVLACE